MPAMSASGLPPGADPFAYTDGSLLTPWMKAFTPRGVNTGYQPFYSGVGQFNYNAPPAETVRPGTIQGPQNFSYADFEMPTAETMQVDPGYQFRLDQGRKALEASAAAKGSLRSGAVMKGLMDYGQNMGSQEFGNVYNRARDVYGMNRGNAAENFDRNTANSLAVQNANVSNRLRADEVNAGNSLASSRLGYDIAQGAYDRNYGAARQQYQDAREWERGAYDRGLGEYMLDRDNFQTNQNTQFGRLAQMAQMGNPAGYAQSMADLFTGAGNANAAGIVGRGNAWTNAFGNFGNTAMDAAAWYANRPPARPPMYSGMPPNGAAWG